MRHSTANLKRMEALLKSDGYTIRYEKGNFKSGYCLLENKRVIIINKFFDLKNKIESLSSIIGQIYQIVPDYFLPDDKSFLDSILKNELEVNLVA